MTFLFNCLCNLQSSEASNNFKSTLIDLVV